MEKEYGIDLNTGKIQEKVSNGEILNIAKSKKKHVIF